MDINKKIEEIRKKPEHVRLRYVWGGVLISMILIIILWAFSVKTNFQSLKLDTTDESLSELTTELKQKSGEGNDAIKDILESTKQLNESKEIPASDLNGTLE